MYIAATPGTLDALRSILPGGRGLRGLMQALQISGVPSQLEIYLQHQITLGIHARFYVRNSNVKRFAGIVSQHHFQQPITGLALAQDGPMLGGYLIRGYDVSALAFIQQSISDTALFHPDIDNYLDP